MKLVLSSEEATTLRHEVTTRRQDGEGCAFTRKTANLYELHKPPDPDVTVLRSFRVLR